MANPICIAHRGVAGLAPENTLTSFQQAMEYNPDAMELDLHLSKDGELMVIHDNAVDRTTNGTGKVADLTLAELKQLDAGSWFNKKYAGERIPTFAEVLSLTKGKVNLLIELKAAGTAEKAVPILEQFGMINQVIITSFNPEYLKIAKQLNPNISMMHIFHTNPNEKDNIAPLTYTTRTLAVSANLMAINYGAVTPALIQTAHQRGLLLGVYSVDIEPDIQAMVELGVDNITSNYIDRLLKVVRK
jgi:glycerophosphoryl diester phosphodiesterase